MNKIFRVIWSKTVNSFVVVSELATGQCKASSAGKEPADINKQNNFLSKLSKFYLNPVAVAVAVFVGTMSTSECLGIS
ncbi:hypothetical protein B0186_09395 [Canicola haemoglobinophilus]|uniref:Hemagluttinin family protein n=1 Tax=Canicola haemoglobinophilus TaxID=733 RepID=A0A1V4AZ66_9PAST|nr:ESPR domain-containing protein [Canicola haemoglobinophilus]OOR98263.1 hypothetical protein B0186_09395 [Canicola haemoglobinophilus]STO55058.1 hemagluttinin family protein [Canicola haemoglobinophilus]STO59199.1 hemagluttinin family protein [Canicola haemoglobinophilus]STO69371.1 hemagluttinin family protein [Canicola haemoglobinophilus]